MIKLFYIISTCIILFVSGCEDTVDKNVDAAFVAGLCKVDQAIFSGPVTAHGKPKTRQGSKMYSLIFRENSGRSDIKILDNLENIDVEKI